MKFMFFKKLPQVKDSRNCTMHNKWVGFAEEELSRGY